MSSTTDFYPFKDIWTTEAGQWAKKFYPNKKVREFISDTIDDMAIVTWVSKADEDIDDKDLSNYQVEVCAFWTDTHVRSIPLIDLLHDGIDQYMYGGDQEIAALENLKKGIDDIIEYLKENKLEEPADDTRI